MSKEKNISEIRKFQELGDKHISLEEKLDELIVLLNNSDLDTENIKKIQATFNDAIEKKLNNKELVEEIKEVSMLNIDNIEKLSQLEVLLNNNYIDSRQAKKIKYKESIAKVIQATVGFLMVTLGFAMVVLPAPPYFEMFTIFHFTHDDGFTLMDLISLIIIGTGIYVVIKSYTKFNL